MKIKKNPLILESVLVEADEEAAKTIDTDDVSAKELADAAGISTQNAADIKKVADTVVIENPTADPTNNQQVLGVDNIITKALDECLYIARRGIRQKRPKDANLVIIGLPGSAKTASVADWCASNNLNMLQVTVTDSDLKTGLYGYTIIDQENPGKNQVVKAASTFLNKLRKPNSILFLDEFTRGDYGERGALLTLINNKCIPGVGHADTKPEDMAEALKQGYYYKNGCLYFPNLLFTVMAANPENAADRGTKPFNSAELSRSYKILDNINSDPDTAADYFTKTWNDSIAKLDPKSPYFLEDLKDFLYSQYIALYFVNDQSFKFSTVEEDREATRLHKLPLNQRTLSKLFNNTDGDVDKIERYLTSGNNFMNGGADGTGTDDVDMLLKILQKLKKDLPTFEDLVISKKAEFKKLGIKDNLPDANELAKMLAGGTTTAANDDSSTEDAESDDEFWGKVGVDANGEKKVPSSANEVKNAFDNAFDPWIK